MDQVAVIVPVYKVEPYLGSCVASLRAQTYANIAIVLVDDGSPDRCGDMCEEFARKDARITVIHRANGGLSAARNSGLDWVHAHPEVKWITFVDSDDTVHRDFVTMLVEGVQTCGAEISAVSFERVWNEVPKDIPMGATFEAQSPEDFWCADQVRATMATCKLYARRCLDDVRFPEGVLHEDELTTYKVLFGVSCIAVSDRKPYYYLQRRDGIMAYGGKIWTPGVLIQSRGLRQQIAFFRRRGYNAAAVASLRSLAACYAKQYAMVRGQKTFRSHLPMLKKWACATLRMARCRENQQMGELWFVYFDLWPLAFNRLTWPFVRVYDLVTNSGFSGLWRQIWYRMCSSRSLSGVCNPCA